jgi:hypothetical protein
LAEDAATDCAEVAKEVGDFLASPDGAADCELCRETDFAFAVADDGVAAVGCWFTLGFGACEWELFLIFDSC